MALVMLCFHFSELYYFPSPLYLPGQGVSTEVCNLQGPAKLNALGDLRNVCRRKKEDKSQHYGHTELRGGWGSYSMKQIILSCL